MSYIIAIELNYYIYIKDSHFIHFIASKKVKKVKG